jgi:hypothetical protein
MAVTTAAVHAGASGAAVLCAASGRLAAVATSNSRHQSAGAPREGALGGPAPRVSTLPRWNYAVPADALRPIWAWARAEAARAGGAAFDARVAGAALREIDRRAWEEGGEAAARVWALLPPDAGRGEGGLGAPRARL